MFYWLGISSTSSGGPEEDQVRGSTFLPSCRLGFRAVDQRDGGRGERR